MILDSNLIFDKLILALIEKNVNSAQELEGFKKKFIKGNKKSKLTHSARLLFISLKQVSF